MKARKILVSLAALALVAAISIGGTLAYLTSKDTVTNTFTVGNVSITLDEADVNEDGAKLYQQDNGKLDTVVTSTLADRVKTNNYKLIPGHTYTKDPTVHVKAKSENSYVFVKVENPITDLEAAGKTTIAAQIATNGWKELTNTEGTAIAGVYYKEYTKNEAQVDLKVFDSFKLADNADTTKTADEKSVYDGAQIIVTAYAVQMDGFTSAYAAWSAAKFN